MKQSRPGCVRAHESRPYCGREMKPLALLLALYLSGVSQAAQTVPVPPRPVSPAPVPAQISAPVFTPIPIIPSIPVKPPESAGQDDTAQGNTKSLSTGNAGTDDSGGAANAPISTTRSNIKHALETEPTGGQGTSPISAPQAISDQAAQGNLSTFLQTSGNPGTTAPQRWEGEPIPGVDIKLGKDPGGAISTSPTNDQGVFNLGKLMPGRYDLKLSTKGIPLSKSGEARPQAVLIGLLLPAVQKVREVALVIPLAGEPPLEEVSLRVAFTVGKDGSVMALDWGDGKGPVDLDKTGKLIPIPQGMQPGELRGALGVLPSTPNAANAPIQTTRSNIKHSLETEPTGGQSTSPTGTPQAISDQAAQGNLSSFFKTSGNPGTTTPQKQELAPSYLPDAPFLKEAGTSGSTVPQKWEAGVYELQNVLVTSLRTASGTSNGTPTAQETVRPVGGTDIGLERDPGNSLVTSVQTDGQGLFNMGKLMPGKYKLKLSTQGIPLPKSGEAKPQAVLIGLLLPAVQKVREVALVIPLAGEPPLEEVSLRVAFTVGKDGSVMTLDWGDGKGPINLDKTGKLIPIPQGMQPGELRGALAVGNSGNGGADTATPQAMHKPFVITKDPNKSH